MHVGDTRTLEQYVETARRDGVLNQQIRKRSVRSLFQDHTRGPIGSVIGYGFLVMALQSGADARDMR